MRFMEAASITKKQMLLVVAILPPALMFPHVVNAAEKDDNNRPSIYSVFASGDHNDGNNVNPFRSGCLYERLADWNQPRICHSEDTDQTVTSSSSCRPPEATTRELRIHVQPWESSILQAWLFQILCLELLDVPVTIETGSSNTTLDFYDSNSGFIHDNDSGVAVQSNHRLSLENAIAQNLDCSLKRAGSDDNYQPCAHVVMELWDPIHDDVWISDWIHNQSLADPLEFSGWNRYPGIFVPKFTAQRDPTLVSYFGLAGEANRRKLAETFRRPTSWGDYCSMVSLDLCNAPDDTAQRAPRDNQESERYFVKGLYTGHFRRTELNDCDRFPASCSGHLADSTASCNNGGWRLSFVPQQLHHLGITLENQNDYSHSQMVELWQAANATRSNLISSWWTPDVLISAFQGTDAEFVRVTLPAPNQDCLEHRITSHEQCSNDSAIQVGDASGTCQNVPIDVYKLVLSGLDEWLNENDDDQNSSNTNASASTRTNLAREALRLFSISNEQLEDIFQYRLTRITPRDAICDWVVDHLDLIMEKFIPPFPPTQSDSESPTIHPSSQPTSRPVDDSTAIPTTQENFPTTTDLPSTVSASSTPTALLLDVSEEPTTGDVAVPTSTTDPASMGSAMPTTQSPAADTVTVTPTNTPIPTIGNTGQPISTTLDPTVVNSTTSPSSNPTLQASSFEPTTNATVSPTAAPLPTIEETSQVPTTLNYTGSPSTSNGTLSPMPTTSELPTTTVTPTIQPSTGPSSPSFAPTTAESISPTGMETPLSSFSPSDSVNPTTAPPSGMPTSIDPTTAPALLPPSTTTFPSPSSTTRNRKIALSSSCFCVWLAVSFLSMQLV